MDLLRHWLVDHPASGQQTFAVTSPVHADDYRQREGFEVTGPYVPDEQLRGAVATLVRIAMRDYDPLQHESPGSLARDALAAMGVDPTTHRGQ